MPKAWIIPFLPPRFLGGWKGVRSLMEKNGQKDGSPTPHPEVEELEIYSPGRLAWNLQINTNHPFRKANDLNQTSMRTCFHVNFQGCTEKMMVGSSKLSLKVTFQLVELLS